MSKLTDKFEFLITKAFSFPPFVKEFKFCPTRKWPADFAWPAYMLLVEVEGGTYIQGRHTRPIGYRKDCEKYNEAQMLGYKVLRFTCDHIDNLYCVDLLKRFFEENSIN